MQENATMTTVDRSLARLQSVSIICTVLILSIAPYTVAYGLRVSIYGFTEILYFFVSLVILPFLSTIGIVCAFLLAQRKSWQTFGIVLGTIALAVCAFALVQWFKFDLLVKDRIFVPLPWKAISGAIIIALVIYTAAARILGSNKRKTLARILLVLPLFCLAVSSFNAFQYLPWIMERGNTLGPLKRFPAEDMLDTPAPSFSLQALHREPYNLEGDRGKVIVVDFWATWCAPCVMELPHFQKIREEFRNEAAVFLAVSVDLDTVRIRPFIDSLGYSFTTLYGTKQMEDAYRISLIPTTFIIDKKGTIRKIYLGFDKEALGGMRRVIWNLLDE